MVKLVSLAYHQKVTPGKRQIFHARIHGQNRLVDQISYTSSLQSVGSTYWESLLHGNVDSGDALHVLVHDTFVGNRRYCLKGMKGGHESRYRNRMWLIARYQY